MAKKPMSLDDDGAENVTTPTTTSNAPAQPDQEPAAARQGDQHRPYCRVHNVLMRAAKTNGGVTSYACPVPNCKATEKRAQPTSNIPREPQACPNCKGRAEEARRQAEEEGKPRPATAPPVYLEANYALSTYAMLVMACPVDECHFQVKIPRPDIAARSRAQVRRAEQLSER
jgi:hypothetical protein